MNSCSRCIVSQIVITSYSIHYTKLYEIAGVPVHVQRTDGLDMNGMRALADQLRDKLKSGVVALGAAMEDGKVSLLVVVTKDLAGKIKAGELVKSYNFV